MDEASQPEIIKVLDTISVYDCGLCRHIEVVAALRKGCRERGAFGGELTLFGFDAYGEFSALSEADIPGFIG